MRRIRSRVSGNWADAGISFGFRLITLLSRPGMGKTAEYMYEVIKKLSVEFDLWSWPGAKGWRVASDGELRNRNVE